MKKKCLLVYMLILAMIFSIVTQPTTMVEAAKKTTTKKATLKKKKISLKVGKKKKIVIKNKKKKAKYTFQTKNKKIATVSKKGVIKGKRKGTTYIVVKEKSKKKARKVGKVKVIVTAKEKKRDTTTTTSTPTVTPIQTNKPIVSPTVTPTITPVPTLDPALHLTCQIAKDSKNSRAVKVNEDGTSTVSIPANYSNLYIPIGDEAAYDLSAYSKMVIDYSVSDQFRISLFDSKFTNIKPPTSGTAEWSQWEYLGSGSYDGKQEIDITSYDREDVAYIALSCPNALTLTLRDIHFVGNAQLTLEAQHSQQMESGNPVAELTTESNETTIQYLANSATVMLPIGSKNTYNLSQYTALNMDITAENGAYIGLFSSKSVNILPGTKEENKWWRVEADTTEKLRFDLTQIPAESLTDVTYVAIRVDSNQLETIKVRDIYFEGDARREKVIGDPVANVLTVDCSDEIGVARHCASGALYGVTETSPTDVDEFITPLQPNMFTQPALSGTENQHPFGNALAVAERIKDTTATVTIRLSDICPGWPYRFVGMETWKETVSAIIDDKLEANLDNIYGYEIWNEPTGTWTSTTISFEEFWKETYDLIREKDPTADIIGPSYATFDKNQLREFLVYCQENDCMPDIMCWHELTNVGNTAANIKAYRALEQELGMTPLRISINEYCDGIKEREGAPGPCAAYIAKFERYGIDSACLSWWFTDRPGHLGSLLSSPSTKGAGWYFFNWYGSMQGNMLTVTPPNENSKYVDGFASLDEESKELMCLFGGDNDGAIEVKWENLPSWVTQESEMLVEKVEWEGRTIASNGTENITAESEIVWKDGKLSVTIKDTNDTAGYRIRITE